MLLIIRMRTQACPVTIFSWEFLFACFRHNCHLLKTSCVKLMQVHLAVQGISLDVNEPTFVLKVERC